jgi:predicted GTPase
VVVVEDGPTLTHGGMTYGAGIVAARRFGAEPIDPRPYAVGSIAEVLARYPDLGPLVPAMGYGEEQTRELAATLDAVPADLVLAATPIDLTRVLSLNKPVVRVRYDLEETDPAAFAAVLEPAIRLGRAAEAEELVATAGQGP